MWKPLGFFSEKFSSSQRSYSTFGRELTAAKKAVQYFRYMLEGRRFVIFTDHKPLTFAMTSNTNNRLPHEQRYLEYISYFTTDIRHISGSNNFVADALSRVEAIAAPIPLNYDEIAAAQLKDDELLKMLKGNTALKLELRHSSTASKPFYCDVSLNGKVRPYIPKQQRQDIMQLMHNIAHPGIRATRRLVSDRFVWKSINRDRKIFVKSCWNAKKLR